MKRIDAVGKVSCEVHSGRSGITVVSTGISMMGFLER